MEFCVFSIALTDGFAVVGAVILLLRWSCCVCATVFNASTKISSSSSSITIVRAFPPVNGEAAVPFSLESALKRSAVSVADFFTASHLGEAKIPTLLLPSLTVDVVAKRNEDDDDSDDCFAGAVKGVLAAPKSVSTFALLARSAAVIKLFFSSSNFAIFISAFILSSFNVSYT